MGENNCNSCVQASLVEELGKRVERLEADVSNLKQDTGRNDEQIKMIFKILTEIKDSIKDIADKLKETDSRPAKRWDDLIRILMASGVGAIVGHLIGK